MMPRPRARGPQNPIRVPDANDLAAEVREVTRAQHFPPVAVIMGHREWAHLRRQRDYYTHATTWPGGEHTFAGASLITTHKATTPRVIATQAELEDVLLGDGN